MTDPDPLVEELQRARRARTVVVAIAAVMIAIGGVVAMALVVGVFGAAIDSDRSQDHAAVAYVVVGGALTIVIGSVVYLIRQRRRALRGAA